jgi:hypothetical protein
MLCGMLFAQLDAEFSSCWWCCFFFFCFCIGSLLGLSTCNFCYINRNSHTTSVDSLRKKPNKSKSYVPMMNSRTTNKFAKYHYVTNACLASHGLERKLYALPSIPPPHIRLKKKNPEWTRASSHLLFYAQPHIGFAPSPNFPSARRRCGLRDWNPHRRATAADCRTQILIGAPLCLQAAARQLSRCLAGSRDCSLACPSSLHCHLPPMGTRFEETPPLPSTFSFRSSCGEERDGGCRIWRWMLGCLLIVTTNIPLQTMPSLGTTIPTEVWSPSLLSSQEY